MTENIKDNLAQSLLDDRVREAYLHNNKYSIFEKLKFAYGPVDGKLRLQMVFYAISSGLLPLLSSFILYFVVDLLTKSSTSPREILQVTVAYAALYFIFSVTSTLINSKSYNKYSRLRMDFLHQAMEKVMVMDYGLLENPIFIADITKGFNVFSSNVNGLEGVYHKIVDLGGSLVSLVLLSLLIFYLNPILLVVTVLIILMNLYIKNISAKYKHKGQEDLVLIERKINALNMEGSDFKHGKDLKLFSFKKEILDSFKPLNESYKKLIRKNTKREVYTGLGEGFLYIFLVIIGLYFLINSLFSNKLSLSTLTLMITAILLFAQKVEELGRGLSFINEEMLYFQEAMDLIKTDLNSTSGQNFLGQEKNLSIEFRNVSFNYPGSDDLVIEDLSFKIEKGEKIAIVGVNGAGKSTIVKLISGLLLPTRGKIYLNGIDSRELSIEERYKAFSLVLQEVDPLAMSIGENVASSIDNIDRERVKDCLEKVGLGEKIALLEKGIDTQLTKIIDDQGTLLSGGENQKLAIARALYKKDYKAIILDEPTAALDALAEEKIYMDLEGIVEEKTLIFISHRLASTAFCDKIALLDGGKIVEFGSHKDLLKNNGLYKKMFESQGKYYKDQEGGKEDE